MENDLEKTAGEAKHPENGQKQPHRTQEQVKADPTERLSRKQQMFVDEYLIDLNATQAAIRAGYSAKTANVQGARLLEHVSVSIAIEKGMETRLKRVKIDQDRIIMELINVVTADPNELVEFQRTCCRHCYGKRNRYQRTIAEMAKDKAAHTTLMELTGSTKTFDVAGGIGYDPRREPHKKCPECFGRGVGQVHIKDTRNLSPSARALYAGIRQTKDGFEVKMHDKQGYLLLLMRHAGMLNDKLKLQGDANHPLALMMAQLSGKSFKPVS